jgi:mRNA-degrading endonuclease RelE of RelBE toxin-antitoxin system
MTFRVLMEKGAVRDLERLDRNRVQALVQKVREYDGDCGGT